MSAVYFLLCADCKNDHNAKYIWSFDLPSLEEETTSVMMSLPVFQTGENFWAVQVRLEQVWKNKFGSGIRYGINFNYGLGTGPCPRKTPLENTCITGEVIHRHKVLNMYLLQHQNSEFFIIFNIWWASNQSILFLRLASNTYTWLGPFIYPFGSGIEEKIPILLGQIQVPILALDSSMIHIPKIC